LTGHEYSRSGAGGYPLPDSATLRGVDIMTSEGPAQVEIDHPGVRRPAFMLVLTHGAGGGTDAPDLLAARDAALRLGGVVARVTQPYRVKGHRAPGSAARQDAAWVETVTALRAAVAAAGEAEAAGDAEAGQAAGAVAEAGQARGRGSAGRQRRGDRPPEPGILLIQGGRSNGARVACRTAGAAGARAVVALAFPLHPPGRPDRSRAAELREAGTDVLVVSGDRDPFGIPDRADATRVVVLAGESHALSRRPAAVADAVGSWLCDVLLSAGAGSSADDDSAAGDRGT
jgi:predicted alpha/beta-hydrolase family hydrolase